MELSAGVIEMEKNEAKQALNEYRAAVREQAAHRRGAADRELIEIDDAVMRGYRELGRGRRLIERQQVIAAAACRNSSTRAPLARRRVPTPRVDGTRAEPCGHARRRTALLHPRRRHRRLGDLPRRQSAGRAQGRQGEGRGRTPSRRKQRAPMTSWGQARAIVPQVPAPLRPNSHLRNYHILWEAEWDGVPTDPALLKHLGGDLYALLAVWDLSPLERAVLAGQRA